MPIVPVIFMSAQLILVAQEVPQLDVAPTCRAAASVAVGERRDMQVCLREEHQARDKLKDGWDSFAESERARCVRLARTGGPASYVELLTCLQMAKAAESIPNDGALNGRLGR
ncbi:MAG TPA: hypothetical protein VFL54_07810 [Gammaproteobacteria bacterium]|nr:hypothetical protein [Gammaproteobacteria bacterium]